MKTSPTTRRAKFAAIARSPQTWLDLLGLVGFAALVEGARQVYAPAGWLVAGSGLLAFAVLASVGGKRGNGKG
jgi:hypothetical protein